MVINNFSMFPSIPQAAGAYITGLLRSKNIPVKQMDVGLELWRYFLSAEYLSNRNFKPEIFTKYPCPYCPEVDLKKFNEIQNFVVQNIDDAKEILRNKKSFYNLEKFHFAFETISLAESLIFYEYGTLLSNRFIFWPKIGMDIKSVADIYMLSDNCELNPFIQAMEKEIIPKILQESPSLVMMDFMFPWEIIQILTLNKLIKKHCPNTHINFPGHGFDEVSFSRLKSKLEKDQRFFFGYDSMFLYRNDDGLCRLNTDQSGLELNQIEDLAYIENDSINLTKHIESQPYTKGVLPDYSDIPLKEYYIPELVLMDKTSSRCFWGKCNYCSINASLHTRYEFTFDYILRKFQHYKESYGCTHIFLLDEACTPEFASKLSAKLMEKKSDIIWSLRTRVDNKYDHALLSRMYNAGCRELWIGLEAVDKDILKLMNKTDDSENYSTTAAEMLNLCSEIGIGIHFCLIVGFPSETKEQRNKVIEFFNQNKKALSKMPLFATFNTFCLMLDSHMYKCPEEFGITEIINNQDDYNMVEVPYKTKFNDDTRSIHIKNELEKFKEDLLKVIVTDSSLYLSWFNISDSPYELLLKEFYAKQKLNPFQGGKIDPKTRTDK